MYRYVQFHVIWHSFAKMSKWRKTSFLFWYLLGILPKVWVLWQSARLTWYIGWKYPLSAVSHMPFYGNKVVFSDFDLWNTSLNHTIGIISLCSEHLFLSKHFKALPSVYKIWFGLIWPWITTLTFDTHSWIIHFACCGERECRSTKYHSKGLMTQTLMPIRLAWFFYTDF